MSGVVGRVSLGLVLFSLAAPLSAQPAREPGAASHANVDAALAGPLDREIVVRAALRNHPALRTAAHEERALREQAEGEANLPSPELMADVWQIPLKRPLAVDDAGMLMFGLRQEVPAPGARAARADARRHEARARAAVGQITARDIRRGVSQAFIDFAEAFESHRVHVAHHAVLERIHQLAEARLAGGARLADVADVEVERARVSADLISENARVEAARYALNALLRRSPEASLGEPRWPEQVAPRASVRELLARAERSRPERIAARAERDARRAQSLARQREATLPSFSVAGLYFAPTGAMNEHGYGLSATMSLPWLWGSARSEARAERQLESAAEAGIATTELEIAREVAGALAQADAAAARLRVLRERVKPATERAAAAHLSGYESGGSNLPVVLEAERRVLETSAAIVTARAAYARALIELEWSVPGEGLRAGRSATQPATQREEAP